MATKNLRLYLKFTVVGAFFLCVLTGCTVELYSQLEEQEGNEMLALLLEHDISSNKQSQKDSMVSLNVDSSKISEAVEVLRKNGYPKNKFSTIGDVFNTDKLISTPFEDHTRYIYGLSQEMAETLSQVDGVMTARVHVVPADEDHTDDAEPASAAVFIKHNPNYNFDAYVSQIKSIVSSGIAGLSYDAVTVALFPAQQEDTVMLEQPNFKSVLSIDIRARSLPQFYLVVSVLLLLIVISAAINIYLFMRKNLRGPVKPIQQNR